MSVEDPSTDQLTRLAGQIHEIGSQLGFTEEESSFLLKMAGMKVYRQPYDSSPQLVELGQQIGSRTSSFLQEFLDQRFYYGPKGALGVYMDESEIVGIRRRLNKARR